MHILSPVTCVCVVCFWLSFVKMNDLNTVVLGEDCIKASGNQDSETMVFI